MWEENNSKPNRENVVFPDQPEQKKHRKGISKPMRIWAVVLAVVLVLSACLWIAYRERKLLSAMPQQLLVQLLLWRGVEFPPGDTPEEWGETVKVHIRHCEEDPDYDPVVSWSALLNFLEDIRIAVIDFYGIEGARPPEKIA